MPIVPWSSFLQKAEAERPPANSGSFGKLPLEQKRQKTMKRSDESRKTQHDLVLTCLRWSASLFALCVLPLPRASLEPPCTYSDMITSQNIFGRGSSCRTKSMLADLRSPSSFCIIHHFTQYRIVVRWLGHWNHNWENPSWVFQDSVFNGCKFCRFLLCNPRSRQSICYFWRVHCR